MKKIAFIGAYDKTDFLLYVSKIMSVAEKKILLVDDNEASTTDGRDGYEAPLGVSTRDTEKNDTESNNTPQAVGLGFIAAAVIASGAAASYAITKQDNKE